MPLSKNQIHTLLKLTAKVEDDSIDCDGCYGSVAELSEVQEEGLKVPQALQAIEVHLRQCVCCKDEYESLRDGLKSLAVS